jgi:sulfhydrogenase subunit alpha|uniref:Ni/Fe hydrogenase subunit alpha n=1 Tax=Desulfobacca acetoxidans TaxID=60893 RepID=A0A7V6DNX3_9BACT
MNKEQRIIKVDYLARVEGEGGIFLKIKCDRVERAEVRIFEPPRFFEAFLQGRRYAEAPDFTARICGICPVAYQTSAVQAMEDLMGMEVPENLVKLRRLLYIGEWLSSHALHVFFLHAPDFLGYQDAIQMARDHGDMVKLGLELKKAGNALFACIGGREVHPVNVRVGGFYRAPTKKELTVLLEQLKKGREAAIQTVRWTATLPFPDFEPDYEFVALNHPEEYAITRGRLKSSRGLDLPISAYEDHFAEEQAPYSHALQSVRRGGGAYFVGPLARFNLNFKQLSPLAQAEARSAGLTPLVRNPFKSIMVRAVEMLHVVEEAAALIEAYEEPEEPAVPVRIRAGKGCGISEAPRGILYHRYRIDDQGLIQEAQIVPPTSQNQKSMEADLAQFAGRFLDLSDDELTWRLEQAVRNYDPCISCATHCLKVRVVREG